MKRNLRSLFVTGACVLGVVASSDQTQVDAVPDDLRAAIEVLRSDVNSFKIRTLNEALQMTGPEAERFWPVYRRYEQELAVVGNEKIALLSEFHAHHTRGTFDDAAADALAKRWLKNVQARLDLWKKYYRQIAKAVSPARAAQFLQVEHQLALFLDLNIASEMPALRKATNPAAR